MPELMIDNDDLTLVKAILKKSVPEYMVMAYGSRVKGTSHEGSDLDLVVKNVYEPEKPNPKLTNLKQRFSDSNLPILIDVMDWAFLPASYRAEVEHLNVILQPEKSAKKI